MKLIVRLLFGFGFAAAGVLHFLREPNFTKIIPGYIPFKKTVTYVSGVIEIIMGIYLIFNKPGERAKKLINSFLLAVFPANIHMATEQIPLGDKELPKSALYGRLPLQFVMMKMINWL